MTAGLCWREHAAIAGSPDAKAGRAPSPDQEPSAFCRMIEPTHHRPCFRWRDLSCTRPARSTPSSTTTSKQPRQFQLNPPRPLSPAPKWHFPVPFTAQVSNLLCSQELLIADGRQGWAESCSSNLPNTTARVTPSWGALQNPSLHPPSTQLAAPGNRAAADTEL